MAGLGGQICRFGRKIWQVRAVKMAGLAGKFGRFGWTIWQVWAENLAGGGQQKSAMTIFFIKEVCD